MKKIILFTGMCLLLCGCVSRSQESLTPPDTVEVIVEEESAGGTAPEIEQEKSVYLEMDDYKKLVGSISELVYMTNAVQIQELGQNPDSYMYIMDYVFGTYSLLPINEPEVISGDPDGKIAPVDSGVTCYTLPEEDVYWVFKNVFGLENMTLSDFRKIEYLEPGLCSNYYVQDGLVYYYSEDESWVSWGEKLIAGMVLDNGDIYFKVKGYDMYQGSFDFYVLTTLKELENGDRFWRFKQAGRDPISIEAGTSEIVYFDQPFDDSFEEAYITFLWDVVRGNQRISNEISPNGVLNQSSVRFLPVYINDDDIPEVLISDSGSHVDPVHLFTYVDGAVKGLGFYGGFGGLEYLEREGKFCSSYSGMGADCYVFYEFDGKDVKEFATAVQHMSEDMENSTDSYCYVNDVEATKKEVEEFLERENYPKYITTIYDDYYDMDLITIAAVLKKYDGISDNTKLEWIKDGMVIPLPKKAEVDPNLSVGSTNEGEKQSAKELTSDEGLILAAMNYYEKTNGYSAPRAAIDRVNGDVVTIHLYDDNGENISTYDWYEVNRYTGIGTNFFGDEINIFEYELDNGQVSKESASEKNVPDETVKNMYVGSFGDSVSQQARMDIVENKDGTFGVEVSWTSSAWENSTWTMTAELEYNEKLSAWVLAYSDCKNVDAFYADSGEMTETVIYENGSGILYLVGNQSVLWQDEKYGESKECVFVKVNM